MCKNGTFDPNAYYNYDSDNGSCDAGPTPWICILFLALFGITTTVHLLQALRYRLWFMIPTMVVGGMGELVGWAGRYWSSQNPESFKAFIIQITTTIFSPSFLTAANFIILGRTISYTNGQQYARLSPRKFTWLFLSFDILCLFIQSAGGGIASTTNIQQAKVGSDIAIVGIAAQTAAIAIYTLVAADFIWRLHANKPVRKVAPEGAEVASENTDLDGVVFSQPGVPNRIPGKIQLAFFGLAVSTLFLLIRAIYRLIEFADGWGGRVQSTETYFNILDGGDIIVAMFAINLMHPGWLLPAKHL